MANRRGAGQIIVNNLNDSFREKPWIIPDPSHLGNIEQAAEYMKTNKQNAYSMAGYMVKPGAEEILFDKSVMAIAHDTTTKLWAGNFIRDIPAVYLKVRNTPCLQNLLYAD